MRISLSATTAVATAFFTVLSAASPAATTPTPAPTTTPAPAPSALPSSSPASTAIHCPGIGDGSFASANREYTAIDGASNAPVALGPIPTSGGPGMIVLFNGALDPGFDRWLALGPQAQAQACDLDITVAPNAPYSRFELTGALPFAIVHDPDRGANMVRRLELHYTEIGRLGF